MINIKNIWENQKPTGDIIIKTKIEDVQHLNCFAATNHITGQYLFILSISNNIAVPELKNYRFRGVEIFPIDAKNSTELNIYLIDNCLKDIFCLFIQNIIEETHKSVTEIDAIQTVLIVISKWKKLFDKISFNGLTMKQQKGLIGELLFINLLFKKKKSVVDVLEAWSGADFGDKDFTFGLIGTEIKFSSSKNPKIQISSERQLDDQNLDKLFLILFTAEAVKENGFSLNSLVEAINQHILTDDERNLFNKKLLQMGYLQEDYEQYTNMFSLKKTFCYSILAEFPKIVKRNLPLGVYNASYSIEVSAADSFIIDIEEIFQQI